MIGQGKLKALAGPGQIAARIVASYSLLAGMWIVFSDRLLVTLVKDPQLLTWLQTFKGELFVVITSIFLYLLIKRGMADIGKVARLRWESESRFQSLLQTAPVSIWEVDLSSAKTLLDDTATLKSQDYGTYFNSHQELVDQFLSGLRIIDVNLATLEIFEANSKEELLGGLSGLFPDEARQGLRQGLIAMAERKAVMEIEVPVRTLKGKKRIIMVRLEIPPDRKALGHRPVCVVDVTERIRMEERLRQLEAALNLSGEAVTITTADLELPGPTIVYVNPAFTALTGYTAEEAVGQTPRILHGPGTDREVLDRMRVHLWQRQTFRCETLNYRKDGSKFINAWCVAPVLDKNFRVTHFVATQRDVTARMKDEG